MPPMAITSESFCNRLEILQEPGKGPNGEVHPAFDNFLQRLVANTFRELMISRLRNAVERYISSVGLHV